MNRSESDRFWSHVVKGPEPDDCWIWTGAISDDGYGRFWITRDGKQRAVRPQRYAHEEVTGRHLTPAVQLLHRCDNPLCVHAVADPALSHVSEGTHRTNMIDREQKNRTRNGRTALYSATQSRAIRVQRSRTLRAVVTEFGWDRNRIAAALAGVDQHHPHLF
ncbi:MAG TPA: hypothetical protein VGP24_12305 [Glaciihabitans sp.]|nr:hypothetical protein [Glaciihabitans sp.]